MKAVSLFAVLTTAHLLMLIGTPIPLSGWTPFVFAWQDILVALIFAVIGRFRMAWAIYGLLVIYIAVNVPIALVLSSPLTWPMIRAAGGPLSDSIAFYFTLKNIGAIVVVLASGILFPVILNRFKFRPQPYLLVPAAVFLIIGVLATSRIETLGFHRNALGALWPVAAPKSDGAPFDWRQSPFPSQAGEDLSRYAGSAKGRNVMMIVLESTASRYLRPYGSADDPMPNLTQLSKESILFENAYSVYPESIKGLFSTICSRYPRFNSNAEDYDTLPCHSLAQQLRLNGYRTALFHSGRFMYLGMESVINERGFDVLEDAGAIGGDFNSSFGIDEASAVRRMLSWIDQQPKDAPFFVTYLPVAGHHPYATPAPGPFSGNEPLDLYRNAIHAGDAALGELFAGLRARRLYDNTLFIVFSDHGEAFGQHASNYGHTLFIYDENIRVPYLIAAPGAIREPLRIARAASLIDTAPTVLDLVGVPIPEDAQGSSLLRPEQRMALFFTDYSLGWLGLRDACWKYTQETGSGRSRLYDVCKDPEETRDLSTLNRYRVERYRKIVEHWISKNS